MPAGSGEIIPLWTGHLGTGEAMPKVLSSGQIKLPGGHAEFGGNRFRKGGGFAALLMEISMALLGQ